MSINSSHNGLLLLVKEGGVTGLVPGAGAVGWVLVLGLGLICSPQTTKRVVLKPGGLHVTNMAVACLPFVSSRTLTWLGATISLANTL